MATHGLRIAAPGHEVKQVPATYAKPFVPIKTNDQLDLQALHGGARTRLTGDQTAVINQLRGFLLEHGTCAPRAPLPAGQLPQILAPRTDVFSPRMARIIGDLIGDWE